MLGRKQHPLAFCAQLGERLTPYEARERNDENPKRSYTYSCVICEKPLTLGAEVQGFLSHPIFIQDKKDDHDGCLERTYMYYVTPDLKYCLEFEEGIAETAIVAEKLEFLVERLQNIHIQHRKYNNPEPFGFDPQWYSIDSSLRKASKNYNLLKTSLAEAESFYNEFQLGAG